MKQEKLVTIVIPSYNRRKMLLRCLDCIANQRGIEQFALIVVDNGSGDGTAEALELWRREHAGVDMKIMSEPERGATYARNTGLAAVETPYVMFFDSDDEMLDGHLARLLRGIEANPDADILGWTASCELPDGRIYQARFEAEDVLYNQMIHSVLSTQRYAAKTDFVREVGGWTPGLRGWNDFELGVRMALANPKVVKLADPAGRALVRTNFTQDSITGSTFSSDPTKWETSLDKIEQEIAKTRPVALPLVAFRRAVLAGHYRHEGAKAEARRLLAQTKAPGFGRAKARTVSWVIGLTGRGATAPARLLVGKCR